MLRSDGVPRNGVMLVSASLVARLTDAAAGGNVAVGTPMAASYYGNTYGNLQGNTTFAKLTRRLKTC